MSCNVSSLHFHIAYSHLNFNVHTLYMTWPSDNMCSYIHNYILPVENLVMTWHDITGDNIPVHIAVRISL